MDLPEQLKNDPQRKKLLQQILDAHDNAVISHKFDESENVVVLYDKYSVIAIKKLTNQLRRYEQITYPEIFCKRYINRQNVIIVDDLGDKRDQLQILEIELTKALENEDYEACDKIKNKIKKYKNNG